jgi:DNA-binding transcriptional regulator LsrR (DeoR family)
VVLSRPLKFIQRRIIMEELKISEIAQSWAVEFRIVAREIEQLEKKGTIGSKVAAESVTSVCDLLEEKIERFGPKGTRVYWGGNDFEYCTD